MSLRSLGLILGLALYLMLVPAILHAGHLDELTPEQLTELKLVMEARLKEVSNHPVLCLSSARECISGYDKLLAFDWTQSGLDPKKRIILSSRHPSGAHPEYYLLNLRESRQRIGQLLGTRMESALHLLEIAQQASRGLDPPTCPACLDPSEPPRPCSERESFYDGLFAPEELQATVAIGYFDMHDENLSGYLSQQLFKTRKVPIDLAGNTELIHSYLEHLKRAGFTLETADSNEWHLSREFFYKGTKKKARVHLYSSTVLCEGEKTDKKGLLHRYDNEWCPEQKSATLKTKNAFVEALGKHQIVIYPGHSRLGKGPDFGPLGKTEGKFPLARGGLDDIRFPKKSVLFLDSCDSIPHFGEAIQKKRKELPKTDDLLFIGARNDNAWANGPEMTSSLLSMLLEGKCPRDIMDVLNLPNPSGSPAVFRSSETDGWLKEFQDRTPPRTRYRAVSGPPDQATHCYRIATSGEPVGLPVDENFCAVRYSRSPATDGVDRCFLADQAGTPFGTALDPALCAD